MRSLAWMMICVSVALSASAGVVRLGGRAAEISRCHSTVGQSRKIPSV
jgi:hypothetical protein